jgi:hypothetical protein
MFMKIKRLSEEMGEMCGPTQKIKYLILNGLLNPILGYHRAETR